MKISKKEILKSPCRKWNDTERLYDKIWLVPSGFKHESGYMMIAIIGVYNRNGKEMYEICGYPDDISCYFPVEAISPKFETALVRMDCIYPSGILQYHGRGKFKVSEALSSMDIRFIKG